MKYSRRRPIDRGLAPSRRPSAPQAGGIVDRRPEAASQRDMVRMAQASVHRSETVQLRGDEGASPASTAGATVTSGLPTSLRSGIESLSGLSMGDVSVHYNSTRPAQLGALAYAQGRDIHLGPGQERHLPHESWHVVQQKQRRVRPTLQAKGLEINGEQGLEREADVMGERAARVGASLPSLGARAGRGEREVAPSTTGSRGGQDGDSPVQCYRPIGAFGRFSDGNSCMVMNNQHLWATEDKIQEANESLTRRGSYVRLATTSLKVENGRGSMIHQVKPTWNDAKGVDPRQARARLKEKNAEQGGYITHADCFMTAQTVMGVDDSETGRADLTAPYFRADHTPLTPYTNTQANELFQAGGLVGLSGNSPSRAYYKLLYATFGEFFEALRTPEGLPDSVDRPQAAAFLKDFGEYADEESAPALNGLIRAYAALAADPSFNTLLPYFSELFAINEELAPEVGDGITIYNDPLERARVNEDVDARRLSATRTMWNYHFAGVVMTDGDDYVTLENYSVGDDKVDNKEWLFQMYGKGEQSFHAEMKGKAGIGAHPISLGFTARAPATTARPAVRISPHFAELFGRRRPPGV